MMGNAFEQMDVLIARFLVGEATAEELHRLENWRQESSENELYFQKNKSLMEKIHFAVDTDLAWTKLEQRISQPPAKVLPLYRRSGILRAAAAILFLAAFGFIAKWVLSENAAEPLHYKAIGAPVEKVLPDGSKVFINKNSELSYQPGKDGTRTVALKGEAFFEVVHQADKPFIISAGNSLIKDIGTAFNVKAVPGATDIEVLVQSGEVQFYSATNAGLVLKAGEKAIYSAANNRFTRSNPAPAENTISYKTRMFEFKGTPLAEVIAQINNVYNSDIRLESKELGKERLFVNFRNENLDMILNIITETLDLEVTKSDTTFILKPKNRASD